MKKMTSVVLLALATISCAAVFGNPKFSESSVAVIKNGAVFRVIYQGPVKSIVSVKILDAEGQEIFKEKIFSQGKLIRPYNLSQLPKGDYKLCVDEEGGKHLETLCNTDDKEIDLADDQEWYAHMTKIKDSENRYLISIPYQASAEVSISIYDQDHQLVFNEQELINHDFAKIYKLKNLEGAMIKVTNLSIKKEKTFLAD